MHYVLPRKYPASFTKRYLIPSKISKNWCIYDESELTLCVIYGEPVFQSEFIHLLQLYGVEFDFEDSKQWITFEENYYKNGHYQYPILKKQQHKSIYWKNNIAPSGNLNIAEHQFLVKYDGISRWQPISNKMPLLCNHSRCKTIAVDKLSTYWDFKIYEESFDDQSINLHNMYHDDDFDKTTNYKQLLDKL